MIKKTRRNFPLSMLKAMLTRAAVKIAEPFDTSMKSTFDSLRLALPFLLNLVHGGRGSFARAGCALPSRSTVEHSMHTDRTMFLPNRMTYHAESYSCTQIKMRNNSPSSRRPRNIMHAHHACPKWRGLDIPGIVVAQIHPFLTQRSWLG